MVFADSFYETEGVSFGCPQSGCTNNKIPIRIHFTVTPIIYCAMAIFGWGKTKSI